MVKSDKNARIPKNLIPLIMFFQLWVHPAAQASNLWSYSVVWWFHVLPVKQVLGVTSKELIPKGTRFGPLVGESYTNETLPKDADRKYFWRVSALHVSLWICVWNSSVCVCVCFSNLFTSCISIWSRCCGCGMARVSNCGQGLTSCESVTPLCQPLG